VVNIPAPYWDRLLYREVFQRKPILDAWEGVSIHIISPGIYPAKMGADFTDVTKDALVDVSEYTKEKGAGVY
jgi:hypothetical protein